MYPLQIYSALPRRTVSSRDLAYHLATRYTFWRPSAPLRDMLCTLPLSTVSFHDLLCLFATYCAELFTNDLLRYFAHSAVPCYDRYLCLSRSTVPFFCRPLAPSCDLLATFCALCERATVPLLAVWCTFLRPSVILVRMTYCCALSRPDVVCLLARSRLYVFPV